MAVRKKNRAGSFFVTLIVIALISIALMVVVMDQAYKAEYELAEDYIKESHDVVKDSVDGVKDVLADLIEGIKDYNGVGMESENWENASEIHNAKRKEMEDFLTEYLESFTDKKKNLTYKNYFNYYVDEILVVNNFVFLLEDAKVDLGRSPSVEEMNQIVEKFKKDVKAIPTNIQRLYSILEQIDKNGVELSDFSNYVLAMQFYKLIDANIFALDPAKEIYEQADMIKRLDDLFEAFKPLAIDAFIAIVEKLPENVNHLTISKDEKTVDAAREAYQALTLNGFFTAQQLKDMKDEKFHDAEDAFHLADFHMEVLNMMYGSKDKDGKIIPGNNALWINSQIESYSKTTIKADPETKIWIEQLLSYVNTWDNTVWKSRGYKYKLVTHSKDKNYCEETYNMIKRDTLDAYVKSFEKEVAKIREQADHFIYMVNERLPVMAYDLEYQMGIFEDIIGFVNEASNSLAYDKVDFVLGYDSTNGVNNAYITFLKYKEAYAEFRIKVDNRIKEGNDAIKALKDSIQYKCNKNHGKDKCDCVLPAYDKAEVAAAIAKIDGIILEILGQYGLSEEKFNEDLLAYYKGARLLLVKQVALDNAKIAHGSSSVAYKDAGYEALLRQIEIEASVSYKLEAVFDGTNYILVETVYGNDKAPTAALSVYNVAKCLNIINSIDIEK